FFFSSRRRHTRFSRDWSSDVCSSDLILLLVLLIGVTRKPEAAVLTFVLLAIPSILAGAYAGVEAIDRRIPDAARGVGMTGWQIQIGRASCREGVEVRGVGGGVKKKAG